MEPLFQIKKLFTLTGLAPIDHRNGKLIRNTIRCISSFLLFANSIAAIWYLTRGADNFQDYAMSFTAIVITSYALFAYIAQMLKINPTLGVMERLRQTFQERKWKQILLAKIITRFGNRKKITRFGTLQDMLEQQAPFTQRLTISSKTY